MIDLHCHLLPGIDDGPRSMDETVAMARAFVAAGTTSVVATPHVNWDHPDVDAALVHDLVDEVRAELARAEVPLEVLPGAEIALSRVGDLAEEELGRLTLGDGGWLLVEPPFSAGLSGIEAVLDALMLGGHRLLLAHPERSPGLARDPQRLRQYVDAGMLCQITAESLTGRFGREVQRAARRMVHEELAHVISSDAHDPVRRPPGLVAGAATLHDDELGAWMTTGVPAAIVAGGPVPPRPERNGGHRRGGLLTRLRGRGR